ncbi:unnamed protein product, partial [Symbiodinium pilosum]
MSKIKLFPSPTYEVKKSGKSTALVSMILEQYRGCFERVIIFSPSINVDDSWRPVKKYIEEVMKVPTDREQVYLEDWDESALRRIINQQRKITETSKQLLNEAALPDFDSPALHKKTGDAASDTLFIRGRHFQISTIVSTQKLRLISNAVRVNSQFFMVRRLRNQLEKDSLLEELTALVPKADLEAMYEAAGSARLGVFKIRVEDTFLSIDRGTYLLAGLALGTLNWAQLPTGTYIGVRLAACATYVESRNELE